MDINKMMINEIYFVISVVIHCSSTICICVYISVCVFSFLFCYFRSFFFFFGVCCPFMFAKYFIVSAANKDYVVPLFCMYKVNNTFIQS